MNHLVRHGLWGAIAIQLGMAVASPAAAEVQRYVIEPGGEYTYLPSPESLGVPGCDPSDFECGFGIEGSFAVDFDRDVNTATLLDLDLLLLGNEDVQNDPTFEFALVTADRVANWLADRLFEPTPSTGTFARYVDQTFPDLVLTDFVVNDTISLTGGFDATPADGVGVDFDLTATVVPEPSCVVLAGSCLAIVPLLARPRAGRTH